MDSSSSFGPSGVISPTSSRSRAQSVSSDRPSTIGFGFVLPPLDVSPTSCFIAPGAASQIITSDHDSHADAWYDQNGIEPPVEAAAVSAPALLLVNSFLDQLLFNFLQLAKSTSLPSLRQAIMEVLKPKLAHDAITNAEDELKDYMGCASEADYAQPQGSDPGASRNWDVELAWKRIRLRCMVYSSLGDMEEEDEDMYMEQEHLEFGTSDRVSDVVSPAVAIFLTSVLEYMGELTLTVAGQAAYQRVRNKIERELREGSRDPARPADRVVVADSDMERVALDRTLGRLWRGWKKRVRAPANDAAAAAKHPFARSVLLLAEEETETSGQDITGRQRSDTGDGGRDSGPSPQYLPPSGGEELVEAAAKVPLPTTDNDVNEIEVPGLVDYSDDETSVDADDEKEAALMKRPRSCVLLPSFRTTNGLTAVTATARSPSRRRDASAGTVRRSLSAPTRPAPRFYPRVDTPSRASASGSDPEATLAHDDAKTEATATETATETAIETETATAADQDVPPTSSQSDESEYDDAAEEFAFQKAEVVTSSRVSMSISSYTVSSDSDSTGSPYQKRSSIYSARLVDVPKSRGSRSNSAMSESPARSRPVSVSMDKAGQSRPAAVSAGVVSAALPRAAVAAAAAAVSEERWKPSAGQSAAGPFAKRGPVVPEAPAGPTTWPLQNASAVSGQRDGIPTQTPTPTTQPARVPNPGDQAPAADATTAMPYGGRTASPAQGRNKGLPGKINIHTPTHLYDHQASANAKALGLPASPANRFTDGGHASVSRKTPCPSPKPSLRTDSRDVPRGLSRRASDEASLSPQGSARNVLTIHTAASSVSSATSRLKPVRTSEDGSSRSESVARNFEELIQSNQTITYTLTPETMRDVDSKSPVVTRLPSRKTDEVRTPINLSKSSLLAAQSGSGLGSGRLPSPHLPSPSGSLRGAESNSKLSGPGSRTASGLSSAARGVATSLPREPRVPTDTTATEFAHFIRATGPADESKVYIAPQLAAPPPPLSPSKSSVRTSRRASTASIVSRLRYQPRDAIVDGKSDNSDLIDFIRQGPPIASTGHRIPRHVAPFRTTMDSDELSMAVGGRAVDASIPDIRDSLCSTHVTESTPSMHSSINSKSALLRSMGASPIAGSMYGGDDDVMPQRKTRRVRDPYAIDLSDEDEDEDEDEDQDAELRGRRQDMHRARQKAKLHAEREESLAEFLQNYNPPPEPVSSPPRMPKKKASAPSLMARFTRSGAKDKDKTSSTRSAQAASPRGGHVPIQVSIPPDYDQHGAGAGPVDNAPRPRGSSLTSPPRARVPMKKFEPRDPVASKTHTGDLAAFLRSSAPAPASHPEDENGGAGKRLGRKKKTLAA
ncbi:hypothetical protein E4U42_006872 [Claviceps africana]|uniref:Flo11 n=1 Tax=Claviceps africana TaxID=83212 RepID=A0A8K0J2P8_9HYPO|nr:hypothetical protein E4U42_006872 [Claviceps africana]